ncbi:hypothetical protein [Streptomyces sp. NRRL S-495]|uniref:hypothetical protein n=1 Tax=Streptomyces sp. NRRL S-495 TaxID=1609133 RepID=UPI0005F92CD8|nr:hypothetical protein [Streptomyces sp. NRRL S-495]KJY26428.1 hypothetical protein VR45_37015 [Streptomyces sp. NRRL S-495]
MKSSINLPLVGIARRDGADGVAYRTVTPVPIDVVSGLVRESWCSRIAVTDASSDGQWPAEFRAMCVYESQPFVLTGLIGRRSN